MGPNAVEDEKELDEDATEWQNTTHQHPRQGLGVQCLFGHLARDLVGADGRLDSLPMKMIH